MRAHAECRECLANAANCYRQNGSLFAAAKCYEQAALMSKELKEMDTVNSLINRAANLYQQHGSHDSAVQCLEKGGGILESDCPSDALPMFQRAAEIVMIDDRHRQAAGLVSKASRLLVRMGRYDDAVTSVLREMRHLQEVEDLGQQSRLVVVLVLLHLAREDVVAARLAFDQWNGTCELQECATLSELLEGFEQDDGTMAARALAAPFIRHMDVEYARLAATLPTPAVGDSTSGGATDFGGSLC